jgi:benzoyl-CoA 2,3-dioxygenase component B
MNKIEVISAAYRLLLPYQMEGVMKANRVETFDDWKDVFRQWQNDINYDSTLFSSVLEGYEFTEKFSDLLYQEIEFGEFGGARKWNELTEIPRSEVRDLLLKLITIQGDTEFASVELQRKLLDSAPTERDLRSIVRINAEEMRHGWQMSYLLVRYFGDDGKAEARKLLERRADKKERILGAFNQTVEDWLDFFTFTGFVDRDGMYQLKMLSHSGFVPLSGSMGPMPNEESFHLITGLTGLQRILRAGKVPVETVQKVLNRWLPVCFDLFGHERSRGAGKAYLWGLKGRFNENDAGVLADPDTVNEIACSLYHKEVQGLIEFLNKDIAADKPRLYLPDLKFNRSIGEHRGKRYSVRGEALDEATYATHLDRVLPSVEDRLALKNIAKEPDWI